MRSTTWKTLSSSNIAATIIGPISADVLGDDVLVEDLLEIGQVDAGVGDRGPRSPTFWTLSSISLTRRRSCGSSRADLASASWRMTLANSSQRTVGVAPPAPSGSPSRGQQREHLVGERAVAARLADRPEEFPREPALRRDGPVRVDGLRHGRRSAAPDRSVPVCVAELRHDLHRRRLRRRRRSAGRGSAWSAVIGRSRSVASPSDSRQDAATLTYGSKTSTPSSWVRSSGSMQLLLVEQRPGRDEQRIADLVRLAVAAAGSSRSPREPPRKDRARPARRC